MTFQVLQLRLQIYSTISHLKKKKRKSSLVLTVLSSDHSISLFPLYSKTPQGDLFVFSVFSLSLEATPSGLYPHHFLDPSHSARPPAKLKDAAPSPRAWESPGSRHPTPPVALLPSHWLLPLTLLSGFFLPAKSWDALTMCTFLMIHYTLGFKYYLYADKFSNLDLQPRLRALNSTHIRSYTQQPSQYYPIQMAEEYITLTNIKLGS